VACGPLPIHAINLIEQVRSKYFPMKTLTAPLSHPQGLHLHLTFAKCSAGLITDAGLNQIFSSTNNNHYHHNTYHVPNLSGDWFAWEKDILFSGCPFSNGKKVSSLL
jgi:hypothetical protein